MWRFFCRGTGGQRQSAFRSADPPIHRCASPPSCSLSSSASRHGRRWRRRPARSAGSRWTLPRRPVYLPACTAAPRARSRPVPPQIARRASRSSTSASPTTPVLPSRRPSTCGPAAWRRRCRSASAPRGSRSPRRRSARPGRLLYRNFSGAPARDTWYPAALASVFAGRDLDTSQPDIVAHFNSTFQAWHRDPTTPPPADRYDLSTVVLHEIAHGLGFIGALTVENGLGLVGASESSRGPYVYDRHTEDGAGVLLLDSRVYPDRSTALSARAPQRGRLLRRTGRAAGQRPRRALRARRLERGFVVLTPRRGDVRPRARPTAS